VQAGSWAFTNREAIITLAFRHRLPAVYSDRVFVTGGGLVSYGPDRVDQFRRAAGYVDHILKGEKPADINLRTDDLTQPWQSYGQSFRATPQ